MAIRKYRHIMWHCAAGLLTLAALGTGLAACTDELDVPAPGVVDTGIEKGYLNVRLKCGQNATRAEEPGLDKLNENRINSVTLCLSPSAGDRTDGDAPTFMHTFENLGANGEVTLRVPLTMDLVTRLFNEDGSNTCRMFAAVNVDPGDAKTVAELRKLTVESDFASAMEQESFTMDGDAVMTFHPAPEISMADAYGELIVQRSASKIALALDVDEEVTEVVDGETLTWTPNLAGMRVMLQQGVRTSTLDPKPEPNMPSDVYFNTPDDLMYDFTEVKRSADDAYARYDREQKMPFYTYPNQWTGNPDERHGTFMMLSVPWSHDGGTTWRTCYYHVPVVKNDDFQIVRNHSYHVYLHVGVLGSFVPEEPLEMEGDYYVADWGREDIDVDIKDYRYLVVDQNDYVVNNENSITIPFYTSHDTEVIDVKMMFYRYNFSDEGTEFAVTVTKAMNEESTRKNDGTPVFTASFNNDNNVLTITHDLIIWEPYDAAGNLVDLTNGGLTAEGQKSRSKTQTKAMVDAVLNRIRYFLPQPTTPGFDNDEYSRVEFEVTVQHSDVTDGSSGIDKNLYKEVVKITQYPGMYITATKNYVRPGATSFNYNGAEGNTIVNGRTDDWVTGYTNANSIEHNYFNWSCSIGLNTGYLNWNPNLYQITITQLSEELGKIYRIADPRSNYINNNLANSTIDRNENNDNVWNEGDKTYLDHTIEMGFKVAPALGETTSRRLKYYYPTIEDNTSENMITPKIRICSSYGGTAAYLTREMARRRAAAYQELGFCAGRWRLPTFGEVKFIMELSRQNKIPRLFGRDAGIWYYWCAQGAVKVPKRGDTTTSIEIVANPTEGGNSTYPNILNGDNYPDHARFVYDEWDWGTDTLSPRPGATPNRDTPIYTFTWGDRPKTNPIE